ncbi:Holliday junction resolvase [Candidatus Woesearchaeota archaeon]|nr:Holliday junction resolvase [Candidatus Woesearchaeota archaeon]MCF7901414.1 Holliday junction resolvase [Candidatus Woesearchaeota archaeon]MCF8012973.1 Holliday junction resolvase [Candidatus Woesearchaeota archaeon]
MSTKSRGSNAERNLIHKFWEKNWAAMRSAGSGSNHYPCPDIVASNNLRKLVLEVKLTTEDKKYFMDKEIEELQEFANLFGGEPYVGIKFFRKDWVFLTLEDLESSGKHFVVTTEIAQRRGLSFEDLINC